MAGCLAPTEVSTNSGKDTYDVWRNPVIITVSSYSHQQNQLSMTLQHQQTVTSSYQRNSAMEKIFQKLHYPWPACRAVLVTRPVLGRLQRMLASIFGRLYILKCDTESLKMHAVQTLDDELPLNCHALVKGSQRLLQKMYGTHWQLHSVLRDVWNINLPCYLYRSKHRQHLSAARLMLRERHQCYT